MKSEPLVSVIIPVYEAEDYLFRCVESIIYQTYSNLEIILVDDESPDLCPKICDNLALFDTRIHVIHKKKEGIASALNIGLEYASGDYITFVACCDFIRADYIYTLISICKKYQCEIAGCIPVKEGKYVSCINNKRGMVRIYKKNAAFFSKNQQVYGKIFISSLFVNKTFPCCKHLQTAFEAIYYRLLYQVHKAALTDKAMYYIHNNRVSMDGITKNNITTELLEVYEDRIRFFTDKERNLLELSHEYYCLGIMRYLMKIRKNNTLKCQFEEWSQLFKLECSRVLNNKVSPLHIKITLFAYSRYLFCFLGRFNKAR